MPKGAQKGIYLMPPSAKTGWKEHQLRKGGWTKHQQRKGGCSVHPRRSSPLRILLPCVVTRRGGCSLQRRQRPLWKARQRCDNMHKDGCSTSRLRRSRSSSMLLPMPLRQRRCRAKMWELPGRSGRQRKRLPCTKRSIGSLLGLVVGRCLSTPNLGVLSTTTAKMTSLPGSPRGHRRRRRRRSAPPPPPPPPQQQQKQQHRKR
mmetsp:Transcript_23236/g.47421  ORF Transcript_23236/g.47421 Transcript_23236/m.47421 type:complete len:203 (+) Transcript_23236:365-973(+)